MKFPQMPKSGYPVKKDWLELLGYVKANSLRSGVGCQVKRSPNGTTIVIDRAKAGKNADPEISWKLSTKFDDPNYQWMVSSTRSTITEGGNGNAIDLSSGSTRWIAASPIKFDVWTTIAATSWIVLECTVIDGTWVLDDFTFKAVTTKANAQEVKFLTSGSYQQEKLRLLIGKIIFTDGIPRVVQGEKNEQFIDWGILNSRAVKCYLGPQRDPDLLV
jgi:hypothetical protein